MANPADFLSDADHAVIEKGFQAEILLNTPAFAEAVNDLSENIANQLLSTDLHEVKRREDLYRLHKSLELIVGTLTSNRIAKVQLEQAAEAKAEEANEEQFIEEK